MPLSQLSVIGLAKETTWGTGVAPTKFMPVTKHDFEDDIKRILDKGKRGVNAVDFGAYTGTRLANLDYGGDFFVDVPPHFILGILGIDTVSGVGPYTHAFTLGNAPPSFSIYDNYAANQRQFTGALVTEFGLKWGTDEATALEWMAKLISKASTTTTTATPTIGTTSPLLGWQAALTLGGSGNTRMLGGELNLKRQVNMVFGANNSQDPSLNQIGPLEVTGKLLFYMTDDTELNNYLNNSQPAVSILFTSGTNTLALALGKCDFEKAKIDRGAEFVKVDAQIRGHYNTADAGPCKITVVNSVASY